METKYLNYKLLLSLMFVLCLVLYVIHALSASLLTEEYKGNYSNILHDATTNNTLVNFTINNGASGADNISNISVALDSNLIYLSGTNASSITTNFTQNSQTLTWSFTAGQIPPAFNVSVWFNITPVAYIEAAATDLFTISVRNASGEVNTSTNAALNPTDFAIDTWNPRVSLVSTDGQNLSGTATFSYTPTDMFLYGCVLWANWSGTWQANETNTTGTSLASGSASSFTIAGIADGDHTWNIKCNDTVSHSAFNESNHTFRMDSTIPRVSLDGPADDFNQTVGTLSLTYTPTDAYLKNCTFWSNFSGSWLNGQTNATLTSGSQSAFAVGPLTNGTYLWNIQCYDLSENVVWNESNRTFTIDGIVPNIVLNAPDDKYNATGNVVFDYTATDDKLKNCTLYVNGTAYDNNSISSGTASQKSLSLSDNTYVWNVTCYDSAGNTNTSVNRQVTTDSVDPVVGLNQPANGTIQKLGAVSFNYAAIDPYIKNCTLWGNWSGTWKANATNLSIANGQPSTPSIADLANGTYKWNVLCYDHMGNNAWNNSNSTFTIDGIVPNIVLNAPDDKYNGTGNVMFDYTATDDRLKNCTLYVNGTSYDNTSISSGTASQKSLSLSDNTYVWNVTCYDLLSNTNTSVNRQVTIDSVDPVVGLNAPANGASQKLGAVSFNYAAIDPYIKNCTLWGNWSGTWKANATNLSIANGQPSTPSIADLANGTYKWNVLCYDHMGNNAWNNSNSTFTIDGQAPSIVLNVPVNDYNTTNPSVTLNFTATDEGVGLTSCSFATNITGSLITYWANGSMGSVASAVLINTSTFPEGTWKWNGNCTDALGNTGLAASDYTFTVDYTAPSVTLGQPSSPDPDGLNYTDYPFKVNATIVDAGIGLDTVWYILQSSPTMMGGTITNASRVLMTGSNTVYTANLSAAFTSAYTGPGAHGIYICANDTLGNSNCNPDLGGAEAGFKIVGANVTQVEDSMNSVAGVSNVNISYENGTDFTGLANPVAYNMTLKLNLSGKYVSIVGFAINESLLRDMNNTNTTTSATPEILNAIGSGYQVTMAWINVSQWLPVGGLFKYGIFELQGTGYDKKKYCNGSIKSPTCYSLAVCNLTVNRTNYRGANLPCFLESGGSTFIYSNTFSGGIGANDTTNPSITVNAPTAGINTSDNTPLFNITFSDINGTGVNNNTVNVTVNGTVYYMGNMTCTANAENMTTSTCSFTATALPDGFISVVAQATDGSNNTNKNTTTINITVDATAPRWNTTWGETNVSSTTPSAGDTIWYAAKWYDETLTLDAVWLVFNGTVVNSTFAPSQGGITNLSYKIPTTTSGTVDIQLYANDTVGNSNYTSAQSITIAEVTPPVINMTRPQNNTYTNATVTLQGTVTDPSGLTGCNYSINSGALDTVLTTSGTAPDFTFEIAQAAYTNGSTYNISIKCIDASSNLNSRTSAFFWTVNDSTAPTVTSSSPSGAQAAGTTSVTISVTLDEIASGCRYGTSSATNYSAMTGTMTSTNNVTWTASITTANGNTYNRYVRCNDTTGNVMNTSTTITFSVSNPATTPSGGGGGGSALSWQAPGSLVTQTKSKMWSSLPAGDTGTMTIDNDEIAVSEVALTAKENLLLPSLFVSSLNAQPDTVKSKLAHVYQYLQFSSVNMEDTEVSGAKITFKVTKKWLSDNNIAENAVALYRYHNDVWNKLRTIKVGSDVYNIKYQAETPGFSYFAVGSDTAAPETTTTQETVEQQPEEQQQEPQIVQEQTPEEQPTEEEPVTETPEETETEKQPVYQTWLLIGAALLLVIIIFFMMSGKKAEKKKKKKHK